MTAKEALELSKSKNITDELRQIISNVEEEIRKEAKKGLTSCRVEMSQFDVFPSRLLAVNEFSRYFSDLGFDLFNHTETCKIRWY